MRSFLICMMTALLLISLSGCFPSYQLYSRAAMGEAQKSNDLFQYFSALSSEKKEYADSIKYYSLFMEYINTGFQNIESLGGKKDLNLEGEYLNFYRNVDKKYKSYLLWKATRYRTLFSYHNEIYAYRLEQYRDHNWESKATLTIEKPSAVQEQVTRTISDADAEVTSTIKSSYGSEPTNMKKAIDIFEKVYFWSSADKVSGVISVVQKSRNEYETVAVFEKLGKAMVRTAIDPNGRPTSYERFAMP